MFLEPWGFIHILLRIPSWNLGRIRNAFSEQKLRDQDESPKLLAIGEAGLDYHYLYSPKRSTNECFPGTTGTGRGTGSPLSDAYPEAEQDTLDILKKLSPSRKGLPIVSPAPWKWQKNWSRWDGILVSIGS